MENQKTLIFLCALLVVFGSHIVCQKLEECHKFDKVIEFNYIKGSGRGPEDWGKLRPDWATCSNGTRQSPIELRDKDAIKHRCDTLDVNYVKSSAVLKNKGYDIMLEWPDGAGSITIKGTKYTLIQLHWHTPSEHKINGRRSAMEMHMVHKSRENKTAVIGVLFDIGHPGDYLLKELAAPLAEMVKTGKDNVHVGHKLPWSVNNLAEYFRYSGSFTTPPCTQDVLWTVTKERMRVTWKQVNLLNCAVAAGYEQNSRPLQPRNGRIIDLFLPEPLSSVSDITEGKASWM